jgi:hypothetical protein
MPLQGMQQGRVRRRFHHHGQSDWMRSRAPRGASPATWTEAWGIGRAGKVHLAAPYPWTRGIPHIAPQAALSRHGASRRLGSGRMGDCITES